MDTSLQTRRITADQCSEAPIYFVINPDKTFVSVSSLVLIWKPSGLYTSWLVIKQTAQVGIMFMTTITGSCLQTSKILVLEPNRFCQLPFTGTALSVWLQY